MSSPPHEPLLEAPHLPWTIHAPAATRPAASAPAHLVARDPARARTIDAAVVATAALDALRALLDAPRAAGDGVRLTDVLHVDLLGATPGVPLLLDALADDADGRPRGLVPHRLDHPDPAAWRRVLGRLAHQGRLAGTVAIVVDPAGNDPATTAAVERLTAAFRDARLDAPARLVAIAPPGSPRHGAAARWLARLAPSPGAEPPFATLSVAGLAACGLAGLDVERVLDGARAIDAWAARPDGPVARVAEAGGVWGGSAALRGLDGLQRALGLTGGRARLDLKVVDDHALGGVVALVEHAALLTRGGAP